MKRDYLNGTPYTMIQKEGMYHFSSDTELLGRFLTVRHKDTVLDIGCSSGALLLYAAVHQPASLCGIDLFDEVLDTARTNLEINGVEAELYKTRVQDFSGRQFSLIVCNPPYFNTEDPSLISANPFIAASRHEEYLRPAELFESAARLLNRRSVRALMRYRIPSTLMLSITTIRIRDGVPGPNEMRLFRFMGPPPGILNTATRSGSPRPFPRPGPSAP